MEKKKLNPIILIAVALSVTAVIMVAAAITLAAKNRAHETEKETEPTWKQTAVVSADTTAEQPVTTTEPEATTEPETTQPVETSATESETAETTSPEEVTTELTTVTTVPTTTTEAETTTVATTEKIEVGVLGYDLSKSYSTDKARAGGSVNSIIINEICAKNKSSLKDRDGEYPDWIELYNPTDKVINLEGVGLSDDANDPLKWVFPSVNIQPNGYLIIFCSDKNTTSPELHTSFKISSGNEQILLSKPDGSVIDSIVVTESDNDVTYGRYPDASGTWKLLDATPGVSNSKSATSRDASVAAPVFSVASGFYDGSFTLTITAAPNTTIYYTTDGSAPTTSSKKYSSEITVRDRSAEKAVYTYMRGTTVDRDSEQFPNTEFEKATIIRAIAVDAQGKVSKISTGTYFIGSQIARKYKNVSVISVVVDPDDLYNDATGIYVAGNVFTEWRKDNRTAELNGSTPANFNQRGREWERDAHIDFFSAGNLEFSENCGVRIHGGWSRNSQQKSLRFYFRSDYGESKLKYELFENNRTYSDGSRIKEYKRFMIRNGGNDSFTLLYKDAWTQACIKDMNFATQDTDLVICFLDGEYWGVYTMTENYDDNYLEENFDVDADNVIMIKAGGLEEGLDTDWSYWQDAVDFVRKNDMSVKENYQKACELFDIESFAEYVAMNIYIGNQDWVWGNWAAWRVRETSSAPYQDGKWRFMTYDTEYSMDLYSNGDDYKYDIFGTLADGGGHLGPMLKSLLKSSDFKSQFVIAFEDVMNIAFNPSSAGALLDQYHSEYSPYMEQHFKRYIFWQNADSVRKNKDSFKQWLRNRYNYMPEQINKYLSLGTTKTNTLSITLNTSAGGTVKINGLPLGFTNGKWSGHYFSGYKITIEAVPAKGYEFTGWSGAYDGTSASITLDPKSSYNLTANFSKK